MPPPSLKPRPVPTKDSSKFVMNASWCVADCVVEVGAVLLDRNTERVLLVYDEERAQYALPRVRRDHFDVLLRAPLRAVEGKVGIPCAPLALPTIVKKTLVPEDGNWRNAKAIEQYSTSETTNDPFHLSVGSLWTTSGESKWPEGYQRITYWYAGELTENLSDEARPGYRLESFGGALALLEEKDNLAWIALTQFVKIQTIVKKFALQCRSIMDSGPA